MNFKFIYAFDEALKDQLLAQGYNSIDTTYITVHCVDGTIPAANA